LLLKKAIEQVGQDKGIQNTWPLTPSLPIECADDIIASWGELADIMDA